MNFKNYFQRRFRFQFFWLFKNVSSFVVKMEFENWTSPFTCLPLIKSCMDLVTSSKLSVLPCFLIGGRQ